MAKSLAAESTRLARFDWPSVATSHLGDQPDLETMGGMRAAIEMLWKAVHGGAAGARMFTEELQQLLENRDVPIVLEAPITSTMLAPDAPGAAANDDYTDILAALRGLMHTSYFDPTAGTSGEAVGGVAGLFKGVTFLQCNANDPHIFNNAADPRWAIVAAGCPHSGLKFSNYFGATRYAKATADWTNTGTGTYESYVDCNVVTDRTGGTVVLRPDGATMTVRVYLPRNSRMDPNVRSGEVVMFLWDDAGRAICHDPMVLDDLIGTVKVFFTSDTTVRDAYGSGVRGWFTMNGSNSTQDMRGRAIIGYNSGDTLYDSIGEAVTASAGTLSGSGTVAISTHAQSGAGTQSVTVTPASAGLETSTIQVDVETNPPTGGDPSVVTSIADDNHSHTATIANSDIASGLSDHTALNISDVAAGLSISGSPRVAGRVMLLIQRMS